MEDTFQQVYNINLDKNISYRTASYGLALINLQSKYLKN